MRSKAEIVEAFGPVVLPITPQARQEAVIVAVDPGSTRSAYVVMQGRHLLTFGIEDNATLLESMRTQRDTANRRLVVEMIASYGMPVGREVFETCVWIGRFREAFDGPCSLVYRREVKLHLCNSVRANDATVRQALLDRFGPQGTKKAPGFLYGIRADVWQALAVAVTWQDGGCTSAIQDVSEATS